jgi:hypothetical protein
MDTLCTSKMKTTTQSLLLSSMLLALAGCGGGGSDATGNPAVNAAATNSPAAAAGNAAAANGGTTPSNGTSAANVTPGTLSCSTGTTSSAPANSPLVAVDTPSADSTRMFQSGAQFQLSFITNAPSADTLNWTISDHLGKVVKTGSFAVAAGPKTTTVNCTSTISGYFAASATLAKGGGKLQSVGTRPAGIATFGVVPNLSGVLPAVTYTHEDQHRFGMQGANDNGPLLADLGISSTIDDRQLSSTEPSGPNQFNPSSSHLDPFYQSGKVMRLIRLDGIPAWASSNGATGDAAGPSNLSYYQNYMSRVGTESNNIRAQYFPTQSANHYQVTWEPDVQWKDSDANFVKLYQAVHAGIHSTDGQGIVMGPTDSFPSLTTAHLKRLAPLGFAQYIDGVTTHGYYDVGVEPSHPPERHSTDPNPADAANALPNEIRALRQEMATDYRPGMKLYNTEVGISYDLGSSYGPNYPTSNVLFAQGAVVARTHIILLGEGVDQSFVFYGADYSNEVGYGTFFDLAHPQGAFGATDLSPKPAAMAVSAMTHVLDGTITLGPVKGTPSGVYAYAFQRRSNGPVVTALWTHNNSVWDASVGFSTTYSKPYSLTVDGPGTSGSVTVLDEMGNPSTQKYTNGVLTLNLTEAPAYVVSNNATVAKANATTPVGYSAN